MIRPKIRVMAALLALVTAGIAASVPTRAVATEADAADPLAGIDEALQKGDVPGALSIAGAAAESLRTRLAGKPAELATSLENLALRLLQGAKIGRASCRERV